MDNIGKGAVTRKNEKEMLKNKKRSKRKQVIYMFISIAVMLFVFWQGYYLIKYTLGYEVDPSNLIIYRWINKVDQKDNTNNYTNEESTTKK